MKPITEKTLIPIGLAVIVIGGAAGWMTRVSVEMSAHAKSLEELTVENQRLGDRVDHVQAHIAAQLAIIRQDLSEVKGELKRIKR